MASFTSQAPYDVRFEWGERGLRALAPHAKLFVIVDVLSFATSVAVACARGATVFPYLWKDERVAEFAAARGALVAGSRWNAQGYSLSPASLTAIPADARLVLPSPNGSQLAFLAAESGDVFAGSLRNASAVAAAVDARGGPVAVIAAGERWRDDESLRPAAEDLIGAGAIIARLHGSVSPEAALARAAYESAAPNLARALRGCASGVELAERGFARDVELAAELDASPVAPMLRDGGFVVERES
jgi:2-phosphosulfolactate phosphatase